MNRNRAIWTGILLWVLVLVAIIGISRLTGQDATKATPELALLGLAVMIVLTLLVSLVYFSGHVRAGGHQGLLLGIVFILVGMILDILVFLPYVLFHGGSYNKLLALYKSTDFAIGILAVLITTLIVGMSARAKQIKHADNRKQTTKKTESRKEAVKVETAPANTTSSTTKKTTKKKAKKKTTKKKR